MPRSLTPDYTIVVGVDIEHAAELRVTWPTWRRHHPESLDRPLLLICDYKGGSLGAWRERLSFVDHPNKRIDIWMPPTDWQRDGATQREIMLTSLVYAPTELVDTPYYLKLDTDAWGCPGKPISPELFEGEPAFVSHRWGYTKPAAAIVALDRWAAQTPLASKPAPIPVPDPSAPRVRHPRIISYAFFGSVKFTRYCVDMLGPRARMNPIVADWANRPYYRCGWNANRLPVPSQDTFLGYCAARSGVLYRRVDMTEYGWRHGRVRSNGTDNRSDELEAAEKSADHC